jgi:predicted DNA-binding transcriptional regulator YafY
VRYARADRLIQLALEMQAARGGLTLTDIEQRFGVSRRTAIRMRDAVLAAFPNADQVPSNDRAKRWRLDGAGARSLAVTTADDLAALDNAAALLDRANLADQADALRGIGSRLKAGLAADLMRRIEPDLAALSEAEGIALRAGPRPVIPNSLFATLRAAIKACRKLRFSYEGRIRGQTEDRIVRPLGFLYGHRHYLVAAPDGADPAGAPGGPIRFFSLPQISRPRLLDEGFARDDRFDFRSLVAGSFGVFAEAPQDIIWKFSPEAAPIARQFEFHPTQTSETLADGSLIVRFHAGGLLEMAWHLMTWGTHVEVLEPAALREMLPASRPDWPALP